MKKLILLSSLLFVLFVAMGGDCDGNRHYRCYECEKRESELQKEKCNGCEKLAGVEQWLVTLVFKDHAGKQRQFSVSVKTPNGFQAYVYEIRGVRPDNVIEYYYSEEKPTKEETGLLKFHEINGALKLVDYTSVTLGLVPCVAQPLDEVSKKAEAHYNLYMKMHAECPRHSWDWKRSNDRRHY